MNERRREKKTFCVCIICFLVIITAICVLLATFWHAQNVIIFGLVSHYSQRGHAPKNQRAKIISNKCDNAGHNL